MHQLKMDILKFSNTFIKCHWDESTCYAAASNGPFEIFKYLYENVCPCDSFAYSNASMNWHFKVIKYLHENACLLNVRV